MNSIPFETEAIARAGLRSHYEASIADTLLSLWRWRRILAALLFTGLFFGWISLISTPKQYASEAVFQIDFARGENRLGPPTATADSAALVEGEARILRSRQIARHVVVQLNLDKDPEFMSRSGIVSVIRRLLQPAGISNTVKGPGTPDVSTAVREAAVERATSNLMRDVRISNDIRSYLITISVTANAPEKAASIANALAAEYVQNRLIQKLSEAEIDAASALHAAEKIYGEKHPNMIQARSNLAAVREQLQLAEHAEPGDTAIASPLPSQLVSAAQPVAIPVGPNAMVFLLLPALASLAMGICLVLILERRDTGFRTAEDVAAQTGFRCLGMIPNGPETSLEVREALLSTWLAMGLDGASTSPRILMVTSPIPSDAASKLVSNIANWRVAQGARVLVIDASRDRKTGPVSLEEVIEAPEALHAYLDQQKGERLSRLPRATRNTIAKSTLQSFCKRALTHYDLMLIETPPAISLADNMAFGAIADRLILIAKWNSTPRRAITAALRQFHDASLRISGIVLSGVDLAVHRTYRTGDQCYNFAKYRKFFQTVS